MGREKVHSGPSVGQVKVEAAGGGGEDVQHADTEQAGAAEDTEDAKREVGVLAGPEGEAAEVPVPTNKHVVAARGNQHVEHGEVLPEALLEAVGDVRQVDHGAVAVDQERRHTLVVDVAAEEQEQDVAGEGEWAQAKEAGSDRRPGACSDDRADAAQTLVDVFHLDVVWAVGDLHGRLQLRPALVLLALRLAVLHVVVVPPEQVHRDAADDVYAR